MSMNIDDLTIGDAKRIAAQFGGCEQTLLSTAANDWSGESVPVPVLVCTERRGVVFGYTTNASARPIKMTGARMCLYWSTDVGGVFGLCDNGPTPGCKISATVPSVSLEGVTAVFAVDAKAEAAWKAAPIQGR